MTTIVFSGCLKGFYVPRSFSTYRNVNKSEQQRSNKKQQQQKTAPDSRFQSAQRGACVSQMVTCCRANELYSLGNGEPQTQFSLTLFHFPG